MQDDHLREFRKFLTEALSFWGVQLSDFSLSVWWQAMQPYDMEAIRQAFSRHAMNPESGQFAPKPADVVRMLGGSTQDAALVAWAKVDRAVRHVGPYADVVFDDPLIHRVLHDMGGWIGLASRTEDEWPFVAREFENRYRGFRMRGERPEYPRQLTGIVNAANALDGFAGDTPRLIGDQDRCAVVLAGGTDRPLLGISLAAGQVARNAGVLRVVDGRKSA